MTREETSVVRGRVMEPAGCCWVGSFSDTRLTGERVIQHVLPKPGTTLQMAIIQHFTPSNILFQVYIRLPNSYPLLLPINWHIMQGFSREKRILSVTEGRF